jgi:hypothetical protein
MAVSPVILEKKENTVHNLSLSYQAKLMQNSVKRERERERMEQEIETRNKKYRFFWLCG